MKGLTQIEEELLRRSGDLAITRRRIRMVVVAGAAFLTVLAVFAFTTHSTEMLFVLCALYVVITVCEKVAYGWAVLAYKGLIRKLYDRVVELEGGGSGEGEEGLPTAARTNLTP
jgi:hypothetical protein